jgi:hypothetical protein
MVISFFEMMKKYKREGMPLSCVAPSLEGDRAIFRVQGLPCSFNKRYDGFREQVCVLDDFRYKRVGGLFALKMTPVADLLISGVDVLLLTLAVPKQRRFYYFA